MHFGTSASLILADISIFCWFFVAGNDGSVFSIDSSGNITVAKKLDRETKSAYELTVTARDRAGRPTNKSLSSQGKMFWVMVYVKRFWCNKGIKGVHF